MKARIIVGAVLAAVLSVAVATSAPGATKRSAASITVWLQVDAQSGWPGVVAAANAAFQKQHPGVDVNVQYQNWTTHLGSSTPLSRAATRPT
jgi:N,N'-diacetylchitobiose transport system substrate-binding protein